MDKPISELVYACGNNLKGQLGINRISHLNDFTLVEDISELYDQIDEKQSPLHIKKISCGRRHCMALFEYGAFFNWGDNEFGQLGNRKRSFIESPYPKRKFEMHHNVENLVCGLNSAAVIVEAKPPRKKNPNRKVKRSVSLDQVQRLSDESAIKAENDARVTAVLKKEKE